MQAGKARLRKYVVTEQQQVSVPVTREEVRVEREPITDANRDGPWTARRMSEEEHEVVLHEERPVVATEAVPVERVRLAKDQVQDEQTVNVDVRKEEIDTQTDAGTTRGEGRATAEHRATHHEDAVSIRSTTTGPATAAAGPVRALEAACPAAARARGRPAPAVDDAACLISRIGAS